MLGGGRGGCSHGRRMVFRNVVFLLYNIILQTNVSDNWKWLLDPIKGYSVSGAYHLFMDAEGHLARGPKDDIWLNKHVTLNVSLFVWCLFRNSLPTKDNMVWCGVVQVSDNVCFLGCRSRETIEHLFFCCNFFAPLWHRVRCWLGVSSADTVVINTILFSLVSWQVFLYLLIHFWRWYDFRVFE